MPRRVERDFTKLADEIAKIGPETMPDGTEFYPLLVDCELLAMIIVALRLAGECKTVDRNNLN
jgi:hypothetical protein